MGVVHALMPAIETYSIAENLLPLPSSGSPHLSP